MATNNDSRLPRHRAEQPRQHHRDAGSSFFGAATWYVGDHTIKCGVDYTQNDIYNFFGRNLNGVYVFDSIEDFENNEASSYIVRATST